MKGSWLLAHVPWPRECSSHRTRVVAKGGACGGGPVGGRAGGGGTEPGAGPVGGRAGGGGTEPGAGGLSWPGGMRHED